MASLLFMKLDLVKDLVYSIRIEEKYNMVTEVNIHEAKTHLSKLLHQVMAGEEIIIAKSGVAVARIVPINAKKKSAHLAALKAKYGSLPTLMPLCLRMCWRPSNLIELKVAHAHTFGHSYIFVGHC